ncbi:hypothetical protein Tco_0286377 [Tanacetum coccineum]
MSEIEDFRDKPGFSTAIYGRRWTIGRWVVFLEESILKVFGIIITGGVWISWISNVEGAVLYRLLDSTFPRERQLQPVLWRGKILADPDGVFDGSVGQAFFTAKGPIKHDSVKLPGSPSFWGKFLWMIAEHSSLSLTEEADFSSFPYGKKEAIIFVHTFLVSWLGEGKAGISSFSVAYLVGWQALIALKAFEERLQAKSTPLIRNRLQSIIHSPWIAVTSQQPIISLGIATVDVSEVHMLSLCPSRRGETG